MSWSLFLRFSNTYWLVCVPIEDELMTPEHKAEIEKIRTTSATRALEIIRVVMPRKVIDLTELLAVRSNISLRVFRFIW
jgi:hypothetical protein